MEPGIRLWIICLFVSVCSYGQNYFLPKRAITDSIELSKWVPELAKQLLGNYKESNQQSYLSNRFRLQAVANEYASANQTILELRKISADLDPEYPDLLYIQHELYAKARIKEKEFNHSFNNAFEEVFRDRLNKLSDKESVHIYTAFLSRNGVDELKKDLEAMLSSVKDKDSITQRNAINICRNYYIFHMLENVEPVARKLFIEDDERRYFVEDSVLIRTDKGATLSAIVVRKKSSYKQPAALFFTIYTDYDQNLQEAKRSASYGFAGVVVDTRGKRLSPDKIEPYETEIKDINPVIDWISKQPWCDGKVGMYGGSYTGYVQWAATKKLHPALKTIVPYVAAIPGLGLPMENNVFLNANYGWSFYVANNKYLDNKVYFNPARWNNLNQNWYLSGVSYRKYDSVDGQPNPWFQRWIQHPSFDKYWQDKIPFKEDFSKIKIPVLTITGYYDDGQISALYYLNEHYRYNPKADHYLIIGPYDHFGAQHGGVPVLRDYTVDPIALIDTREITYQWLDHILRNGKKPGILKNKINFQVMGDNTWRHVPSIEKMKDKTLTLYLSNIKNDSNYALVVQKPSIPGFVQQEVNLADRYTSNNNEYYPYPIVKNSIDRSTGEFFISEPFQESFSINGMFSGELKASINKKDMDIGITLFEVLPDGTYFHLNYFLGRASYAKDMTKRILLTPGKIESIPFERSRMVSRKISKGSRLLVIIDINKNSFAQVNNGTGKDVSDETIEDGKIPLKIKWYNDSYLKIPVGK